MEKRFKHLVIFCDAPNCKKKSIKRVDNFFKTDRMVAYNALFNEGWVLKDKTLWFCSACKKTQVSWSDKFFPKK